jgi:hypothetical protein
MNPFMIFTFCAIICVPIVAIVTLTAGQPHFRAYMNRRRQAHLDFLAHLDASIAQLATDISELKGKARGLDDEVIDRLLDDAAIYQDYATQSIAQEKYARAFRLIDKGNVYLRWARRYIG